MKDYDLYQSVRVRPTEQLMHEQDQPMVTPTSSGKLAVNTGDADRVRVVIMACASDFRSRRAAALARWLRGHQVRDGPPARQAVARLTRERPGGSAAARRGR